MKSNIDYVIHSALRDNTKPLNILYYPLDGWYENLCLDRENRYYFTVESAVYKWPINQAPENFTVLPYGIKQIPNRLDLDLIIVNHRIEHLEKIKKVSDLFHLPIILVEHNLPKKDASTNIRKYINSRLPLNIHHIVTNDLIKDEWNLEEVQTIPYGLEMNPTWTELKDLENRTNDLIVIGDYSQEDYSLLGEMINSHHTTTALGNNAHYTKSYISTNFLSSQLQSHKVCLMASGDNRPPILQLLAMSQGAVLITNRNRWTEKIIKHEENGLLFNDTKDMKKCVRFALENNTARENIQCNAYKTIRSDHYYDDNTIKWKSYLSSVAGEVYQR